MGALDIFINQLNKTEKKFMESLDKPFKIQAFLDTVEYPGGDENRPAIEVLRQKKAHCLDGGIIRSHSPAHAGIRALDHRYAAGPRER